MLSVCLLTGCAIIDIRKQSHAISKASIINGHVNRDTKRDGPIVVFLLNKENSEVYSLASMTQADSDGQFRLWQLRGTPGIYYVAAYIDANRNGEYDDGEPWNYYGTPTGVELSEGKTVTLPTFSISDQAPIMAATSRIENNLAAAVNNVGNVVKLDDKTFTPENYSMGMWRPLDFLSQVGGGLLFLQEYEKGKIPIIFVHGINGGPTVFNTLIANLDRTHYQPWVFYYPSGLTLDIVSDYLVSSTIHLQNRYGFDRFALVSHSMGGLVARSFVKKYVEKHPKRSDNLLFVFTINSPLSGMPSAASGVNYSPFVVQSWRDVAPDSNFLTNLNSWTWPANIPCYLIFSFEKGADDGVVPLQRQLPLKLQMEAAHVYGFNDSHESTLSDPAFLQLFKTVLSQKHE